MATKLLLNVVLFVTLYLNFPASKAHNLPQPSWDGDLPSVTPLIPRPTSHAADGRRKALPKSTPLVGPLSISIPDVVHGDDRKKAIVESPMTPCPGLGDFDARHEGIGISASTKTPNPRGGGRLYYKKEEMTHDQHDVLASISPSVPEDYKGVWQENWNRASSAVSTAEASYSPSAEHTSVEPDVFVMPALPSTITTPESHEDEESSVLPVSSGISDISPSATPVSVVDLVDNLMESHFSSSPEPSELAKHMQMPSTTDSATPSPVASIAILSLTPTPTATQTATPTPKGACFPGSATVMAQGGLVKRMDELRLGDQVHVGNGKYSPVFMFTHKMKHILSKFVRLHTWSGHVMDLSGTHYIYLNGHLAAASTARAADQVLLGNGTTAWISKVEEVWGDGLFNPQTTNGNIVVNGITASTYTVAIEPSAAHALLAPFRFVFEMFGICMKFAEQGWSAHEYLPNGNPLVL